MAADGDEILHKPVTTPTHSSSCVGCEADHYLYTAMTIVAPNREPIEFLDITSLTMATVDDAFLEQVVLADQPYDCAGAYKIEGQSISLFDAITSKDHTAITGLPLLTLGVFTAIGSRYGVGVQRAGVSHYSFSPLADVEMMHQLLAHLPVQMVLPRSPGELFETLRDFQVATVSSNITDDTVDTVVGCCALQVNGELAEIKSLCVAEAQHGQGLGRRLVEACCAEAAQLGLARVFCLTNQQAFFSRLGFEIVDRARLPEKVWGECVRCDRFFACDEIAMWKTV